MRYAIDSANTNIGGAFQVISNSRRREFFSTVAVENLGPFW